MNNYLHDNTECFCIYCGNNSQLNYTEMCNYCYDDLSLTYYCYICNNYYNYSDINEICSKYITANNIIKKYVKAYLFKNKSFK